MCQNDPVGTSVRISCLQTIKNTILQISCNLYFQSFESKIISKHNAVNRETERSEAVKKGPLFGMRAREKILIT